LKINPGEDKVSERNMIFIDLLNVSARQKAHAINSSNNFQTVFFLYQLFLTLKAPIYKSLLVKLI